MADEPIARGGGGDDVADLVALTERQHELWGLLRDAQDEQVRNELFDELTTNREELARIKEAVAAQVDEPISKPPPTLPGAPAETDRPLSVGEELRSKILSPPEDVAPAQPPPPPPPTAPPPLISRPAPEPEIDPEPDPPSEPAAPSFTVQQPVVRQPSAEPPPEPIEVRRESPSPQLAPEATPFSSREADLAATRRRRGEEPPPPPAEQPSPTTVADGLLEERRRAAHEAYQEMARVRPVHGRSFPVFAIFIAIAAVAAVAWYVFFFNNDDGGDATPATSTTVASLSGEASPGDRIQTMLNGLGLGTVMVDERDGTIYLIGVIESEADRAAVIGASQALAGSIPIDSTGLILSAVDEDLRAAALQAIADAGLDKINVVVAGGVATLTGVTPDDGSAGLVAAVEAVPGISRVVDLTESSDRAAALETELRRVTAVTPIVFESGQVDLNPLQQRILDSAAEIILAYNGPIVTVVGYTDAAGTPEENERISLLRGQRVQEYLISQGVPAERLFVDARGEADSTGSSAVAGLERRVEFEVGYAVPAGGDADFRIGIVAPSARDDLAFTQSIVDAATVIAAERGGVAIDISDGLFVPEDAEAALRAYAADGYDLVIAHGSQYGASLSLLAPEFPNTAFAWGTAADTFGLPNVSAYEVAADEGGYVMGAVAALLTDSDVIGVVGPLEVGDAQLFVNGFRNGVTATDSAVTVLTTYIGSFSDVGLAAEAAAAHVEAGADVLTGSAQMVVGAVGVAAESDAAWFGNQANQTTLAPSLVVASQVYHWEVALRQIVSGLDQGLLGGETYTLTLANGGIIIEYNDGYDLSSNVVATADAVTAAIVAGSVVTGG